MSTLLVLGLTACGDDSGADGGSDEPIKVGAVASLTGAVPFPDSTAGAEAAFAEINENGGINGREIEYTVIDDANDPATAAQGAQRLVNEEGVVANVGSLSAGGDCATNGALYQREEVLTIGMGLQAECATLETFGPVNAGPVISDALLHMFAHEELGASASCYVAVAGPGSVENFNTVKGILAQAGIDFLYEAPATTGNESPTPYIVEAKQRGCPMLYYSGVQPQVVTALQAIQDQGYEGDVVVPGGVYGPGLVEAAGANAEGVYTASEYTPYTSDDPDVNAYRELMEAHDVPVNLFSQGGYIAAQLFAAVLEGIDGEITRASVTAELQRGEAYEHPMLGQPWTFGPFGKRSVQVVQVQDGEFVTVGEPRVLPEDLLPEGLAG